MLRTLYRQLALALGALLLVIGMLYAFLSFFLAQYFQQQALQNLNRDLAGHLIIDRQLLHEGMLDQQAIRQTFDHYMTVNPSIEIYLLNEQGRILSFSADPGKVKRSHVALPPLREFLRGQTFPLLGDDPRSHDRQKIFSVAGIRFASGAPGYLYVVLRGEEYERAEQFIRDNYLYRLSGISLVISLAVGLLAGLWLFRRLTRRLHHLASRMSHFQQSGLLEYQPYVPAGRHHDEIDRIGINYNLMAEKIREQLAALKKQDSLRRELVANVSHDLRTPLATLRGYLETMQMKASKLDEGERAAYIATALHHSERLTRLVEDLFELARLDAEEIRPHCERFALAELVQDVIQKFRLQACSDGIALHMDVDEEVAFVYADIALIERVLENLVANALKHSSRGDRVTVRITKQSEQIDVQVRDTGCGIAADELPYIFDRFYQAANKHRAGAGAGLGLAITRQILRLHDASIEVSSIIDKGTVFRFSLRQAA